MVRLTTSLVGYSAMRPTAEGSSVNSAYASSTMTMPGAASRMARRSAIGVRLPVGLFGEVTKMTSGRCVRMAASDCSMSMSNVAGSRGTARNSVWVPAARMGCME